MQRYFITAETTYETMRRELNAQLSYPNALGQSVFQPPLQSPRDTFGRILLAVDTEVQGYAAINSYITALLSGDLMEEVSQATYLAAADSEASSGALGDVEVTSAQEGDVLRYSSSGKWTNYGEDSLLDAGNF